MSSSKQNKSKLVDPNLFNMQTATPTFKNLLFKYEKQNLTKIKNTKRINANSILLEIDKRRHKIELEEQEGDYMFKELIKNVKFKQELFNNYGLKAYKHYDESPKENFNVKLDKVAFLNSTDEKKKENFRNNKKLKRRNFSLNTGKSKLLKLPEIVNNVETKEDKRIKILNEIKRLNSSLDDFNNDTDTLNKQNTFNVRKSSDNSNIIKINENNDSNKEIQSLTNGFRIQNLSCDRIKKNRALTENNFSRNHLNNKPKGPQKMNKDYLKYLQTFRDKLVLEEKKHKNYFDSNNYGCDSFRQKYNYLNTRFFQTNQED